MDGSQGQAGQPMAAPQQPQHSNLIRTDQVQKLPHLSDQQKAQHTQLVRSLWEMLNTRDPQTHEYQQAHTKLSQLSQNLMKGMRIFQQNRQAAMVQHQNQGAVGAQQGQVQPGQQVQQSQQGQPAQQVAQGTQGQPVQRTQSNNPQAINQLIPQIQARVSALNFFLPPNVTPEQVQTWIPEARLRYGIALQKQEVGRARMAELRSSYAQRQSQGNMSQEEMQEFKNRQLAAEKLFREGSEFLNKFKEQQESFKLQSQQNPQSQTMNQTGQTNPPTNMNQTGGAAPPAATQTVPNTQAGATNMQSGQTPTPAPHTINSAVNAARNQAGQAMSPSASQPGQPASTQSAGNTPVPISAPQPQGQRPQAPSQQGTPGTQVTFSQTPNPDGSTPTPPGPPQQVNSGPPRPLSHQAAISQDAQTYTNPTPQQATAINQQAQVNNQAHPQGYLANRSTDTSSRNINMAIPKNLNVSTPEPVSMPASRPSLSGGPSHGAMGMMGQPAIQKHPGYVLEGEGQRVLSKKMLDILVRQVTGGGEGEMLTPDAEEVSTICEFLLPLPPAHTSQFILQMADDFVDEVITQACRLAKLRPSSTLELRDLQLVLERNYNMRISGFSTDDLRTVKKPQPTQGWTQKMSAIQAAKVTQGRSE